MSVPDQLIRPGDRYYLPEPACRAPARVNADYPSIYERNAAWVREHLPFPDTTALWRMLECRYPLWESLVYPAGLPNRVYHSSCVTSLMFEVDDVALLRRGLFADIATDWNSDHPYGSAFTDIWVTLEQHMPSGVYRRYHREWQDWFVFTLKENEYRGRGEIPDLDAYLDIRRVSVGLRPYIVCLEYVLDLDLTEQIAMDPDLREAGLVAVEHAMLVNDLFSFRWECFKGDFFNAIAPLLHTHGYSLQKAVDVTCTKIADADARLATIGDILRARYAKDPRMHAYIEALNAFCAGNLRWSLETSRYNGRGYGWTGLRSGTVILDPHQTVVEECPRDNGTKP